MIVSLDPWTFTFSCESELRLSRPFQPMKELYMQWSRAFNLVYEVTLSCVTKALGMGLEWARHGASRLSIHQGSTKGLNGQINK